MRALYNKIALLLALALLGGACIGTDVGNPPQPSRTELAFSAEVDDGDEDATDGEALLITRHHALELPDGVTIDEAWFNLSQAALRNDESCSPSDEFVDSGAFAVDLLAGETYPRAVRIDNPSGEYCQIRLEFGPADELSGPAPEELLGASILVRGSRADGVPFVLRVDDPVRLKYIGQPAPIEIEPGVNRFFSYHQIDRWLDAASLDRAGDDEVIRIDRANNQRILQKFLREFRAAARLHRDRNRDGRLEADELPVGEAEAE